MTRCDVTELHRIALLNSHLSYTQQKLDHLTAVIELERYQNVAHARAQSDQISALNRKLWEKEAALEDCERELLAVQQLYLALAKRTGILGKGEEVQTGGEEDETTSVAVEDE